MMVKKVMMMAKRKLMTKNWPIRLNLAHIHQLDKKQKKHVRIECRRNKEIKEEISVEMQNFLKKLMIAN